MFSEAALVSFIVSLFAMVNPVGTLGVFAGMTEGQPAYKTRRIAWTCAGAVAIILLIVAWSGTLLLEFFGITVHSVRAGGGVIVLLIGLHMLFNKSEHKHSSAELKDALKKQNETTSLSVLWIAVS